MEQEVLVKDIINLPHQDQVVVLQLMLVLVVQEVLVERQGDLLRVEIQASGFLYGMVRLLMAQLVAVGEHRLSVAAFEQCWR